MAATVVPQKRVLGESRTRQNIPSSPQSSKKRKTEIDEPAPIPRFVSSRRGPGAKLGASQTKSVFESEVLEKLSQEYRIAS